MTEPNQEPVGSPVPLWVEQQPYQDQPFDQQGSSTPPPAPFQIQDGDQHHGSDPAQPSFQYAFVPPAVVQAETQSPVIALVCGLVCWVVGPLLAVPAVMFGVKGRREAREGRTTKGGMATAGLWLGGVNLVVSVLSLVSAALLLGILSSW